MFVYVAPLACLKEPQGAAATSVQKRGHSFFNL